MHLWDVTKIQDFKEELKTAWGTWKAFLEVTNALNELLKLQNIE